MVEPSSTKSFWHELTHKGEHFLERLAALVVGFLLMVLGVGLSVTMVLLPVGIPVGILGLFVFLGRLFGKAFLRNRKP